MQELITDKVQQVKDLVGKFPEGKVDEQAFFEAQAIYADPMQLLNFYLYREKLNEMGNVRADASELLNMISGAFPVDASDFNTPEENAQANIDEGVLVQEIVQFIVDREYSNVKLELLIQRMKSMVNVMDRVANDFDKAETLAVSVLLSDDFGMIPLKKTEELFTLDGVVQKEARENSKEVIRKHLEKERKTISINDEMITEVVQEESKKEKKAPKTKAKAKKPAKKAVKK